jgi:aminocarboxymuconate-semialdehyde decarboxylase
MIWLNREEAEMSTQQEQLIDTHAHIVPSGLVDEARTSGKSLGVTVEDTDRGPALQFEGLVQLRPLGGLTQLEPRLEWMAKQGLDQQILASWLDIHGYTLSPDNAATWARLFNEHLAQVVDSNGDTFRGLATVPIQDGTMAAKELEYAVNTLGMLGAMVSADPVGHDLSQDSYEPLWAAAESLGVPIVLHPATHGFGGGITPDYLTFSLGRTLDTTITAAKLILEGLFDRHPNLKMVLVHGGGFLPYQAARIDNGYRSGAGRPVELKRDKPSDYLPMLYYDTVNMSPDSLRMMRNVAGAEHIMLGSDYVFSGTPQSLTEPVREAGLEPAEYQLICCGSARKLFFKES